MSAARRAGRAAGRNLRAARVNVDLAPVADVARPGSAMERERRSYGRRPRKVARFASAFATGLRRAGVLATGKHFPGFGAARANTDNVRVTINTPRKRLRRVDERPYRSAVPEGRPAGDAEHGHLPLAPSRASPPRSPAASPGASCAAAWAFAACR